MFYRSPHLRQREDNPLKEKSSAIVVLTPAESKRLIAKAVAQLPEVKGALQKGKVIIGNGTTNAFVAEEILGAQVPKVNYAAGIIANGELSVVPRQDRVNLIVLINGEEADVSLEEALEGFGADDVFIKGANAVDAQGNAGVVMANEVGGTIGKSLPILTARGCHLIVPVGLEKLIPSVIEAANKCGISRFKRATGLAVGFMPLVSVKVVTEIQALEVLGGVTATHVASGGIDGSEGSVVMALEGEEEVVAQAFELVKSIKGEAPVRLS